MFHAVRQVCQDYYSEIPKDTLHTIARSALYSFSITFILTNRKNLLDDANVNFVRPVMAAALGATASLIHALTTPLFNDIFGDNKVRLDRELLKYFFNMTCVYVLWNHLTPYKSHLFTLSVFNIVPLNVFKSEFDLVPTIIEMGQALNGTQSSVPNEIRRIYGILGINVDLGSNSSYISM
jgi:hypothetical protein